MRKSGGHEETLRGSPPEAPRREDRVWRSIAASAGTIYAALIDPVLLARWLPPHGATARVDVFDARPGGEIRITLTFAAPAHTAKTTANTDVVKGRFLSLERDRLVSQSFAFESSDPQFAGTMIMTWTLAARGARTDVELTALDVPPGISQTDHLAGMQSSLANLATLVESSAR